LIDAYPDYGMEAWQHGRETPVMMNIEWEKDWNASLEAIRATHWILACKSIFSGGERPHLNNPRCISQSNLGLCL
jgi:hypothetical protein